MERDFDNFDQFAVEYRNIHNKSIKISGANSEYFSKYKIDELLKYESLGSNLKVLDFGCGDGNSVKYMTEIFSNWDIDGIDVSSESIQQAQFKELENSKFQTFDGLTIPYKSESFDLVFTSMVFHHIEHKLHNDVMKEILRVLKKGGRFYIFEHNPLNPLTRKVVNECPFDEDAVLLSPRYGKKLMKENSFKEPNINFTIFLPRHKLFSKILFLENFLRKVPLGAQYYIRSIKQ